MYVGDTADKQNVLLLQICLGELLVSGGADCSGETNLALNRPVYLSSEYHHPTGAGYFSVGENTLSSF